MRFLVAVVMVAVSVAGCIDGDEPLTTDSVEALLDERLAAVAEDEESNHQLDLDGAMVFRVDGGEWSRVAPFVTTSYNAEHDGGTGPLVLETPDAPVIEVRYDGDITGLEGEWQVWGYSRGGTASLGDTIRIPLDAPGSMDVALFVWDANDSYARIFHSVGWDATWTVTGELESGGGFTAPSAHSVALPAATWAAIDVNVRASDDADVPGRKTALAIREGNWDYACSQPDGATFVDATDHYLQTTTWGEAAPRIDYGFTVEDCYYNDSPAFQSVAYEMVIHVGPVGGGGGIIAVEEASMAVEPDS